MLNYTLTVTNDKGEKITSFQLERGESRKGTFATLSGKPACKALPFGKLYIDEDKLTKADGTKANGKANRKANTSK